MQSKIIELNGKYSLEERKENIKQFIDTHSNEQGIDLRAFVYWVLC